MGELNNNLTLENIKQDLRLMKSSYLSFSYQGIKTTKVEDIFNTAEGIVVNIIEILNNLPDSISKINNKIKVKKIIEKRQEKNPDFEKNIHSELEEEIKALSKTISNEINRANTSMVPLKEVLENLLKVKK